MQRSGEEKNKKGTKKIRRGEGEEEKEEVTWFFSWRNTRLHKTQGGKMKKEDK